VITEKHLVVGLIVVATLMRSAIAFYPEYSSELYLYSAILWSVPFMLYAKVFFGFLMAPRADGING